MRLGAEQREAKRVAPHVETAQRDPDDGSELGPQRLDVADPMQVLADSRIAPRIFVFDEFIIGAAGAERAGNVFGGEYAASHRVVDALDARHVDKAGRAADQRAAGERQPRHRLITACGDAAAAVTKALA